MRHVEPAPADLADHVGAVLHHRRLLIHATGDEGGGYHAPVNGILPRRHMRARVVQREGELEPLPDGVRPRDLHRGERLTRLLHCALGVVKAHALQHTRKHRDRAGAGGGRPHAHTREDAGIDAARGSTTQASLSRRGRRCGPAGQPL